MAKVHKSKPILWKDNDFNPVIRLWHKVFSFAINHKLFESRKQVKKIVVQIFRSIEDEENFSIICKIN